MQLQLEEVDMDNDDGKTFLLWTGWLFYAWGCAVICPCFGAVDSSITGAIKSVCCFHVSKVLSASSCAIFRVRLHLILDK